MLERRHIPRYYFPKEVKIVSVQLHGFSDASEEAYARVVYLRSEDCVWKVHVALVAAKSKVAPIRCLTISRSELCVTLVLAQLLCHVKEVFEISLSDCHAWTHSTILHNCLLGVHVGSRHMWGIVSSALLKLFPLIVSHFSGVQNPPDCASRGLFPLELVSHDLWWNGCEWLYLDLSGWPEECFPSSSPAMETDE